MHRHKLSTCTVITRLSTSTHSWGQSPVTPHGAAARTKDVKGQSRGIKGIYKKKWNKAKNKKSDRISGESSWLTAARWRPLKLLKICRFLAALAVRTLSRASANEFRGLHQNCFVTIQTVKQADSFKQTNKKNQTQNWSTYSWHPNKLDDLKNNNTLFSSLVNRGPNSTFYSLSFQSVSGLLSTFQLSTVLLQLVLIPISCAHSITPHRHPCKSSRLKEQ